MKKRLSFFLALWLFLSCLTPAAFAASQAVIDVRNSIVRLVVVCSNGVFTGTGICVGETGKPVEYIITNNHVVADDGGGVGGVLAIFDNLNANSNTQCTVLQTWEYPDLAILRLETPTTQRKPAKFRSAETVQAGDVVHSIGFPGAADDLKLDQNFPSKPEDATHTQGLVSNPHYEVYTGEIAVQCDSAVNHGNSGGPIIDDDGYVVAFTASGSAEDRSINIPLRIDYALNALDDMSIPYILDSKSNFPLILWCVTGAIVIGFGIAIILVSRTRSNTVQVQRSGSAHGYTQAVSSPNGGATAAVSMPSSPTVAAITRHVSCIAGPLEGKTYTLSSSLTFGRDPSRCGVVLPEQTQGVSKAHCRLDIGAAGVTLTDLDATYGTFLGGEKLTPNRPYPIHRGDSFTLGSDAIKFTLQA